MNKEGPKMYRQGDVLFLEVDSIPAKEKGEGRCVAAFGEVTGHCHEAVDTRNIEFYTDPHTDTGVTEADNPNMPEVGNKMDFPAATWISVQNLIDEVSGKELNECHITHQEHDTVILPAGNYKVIRQREYHPEAIRNVLD